MEGQLAYEIPEVTAPRWEQHYWPRAMHPRIEIPKPCMYKDHPYWMGGLMKNGKIPEHGYEWVSNMQCQVSLIPASDLRPPTDAEYIKYFKTAIEKFQYVLRYKNGGPRVERNFNGKGKHYKCRPRECVVG